MVFSSLTFLFYFMPVVILAYFILPYKNAVLLISSLLFYSWGEPKYIFLMIATVFINYLCGLKIDQDRKHAKQYLILALLVSMGALIVFKYTDFLISTSNSLFSTSLPLLNLALPIGISFYTFQILTYTIDVYREKVAVQKNFFTLLTYVSLFPQLIAGPIVRYSDVERELKERQSTFSSVFDGLSRFVVGLSKKVMLANTLGEINSAFIGMNNPSVLMVWLYAVSFTLQLYFDFSGYSDMAIGLGKLFGFNFLENFNYPLISSSITDFWRRWHISLGTFFRDYVYIPLGGSRTSKGRWVINIIIVWTLTGLWHGAAWNFIVWGLLFALLLMVEKFLTLTSQNHKILKVLSVFIIIVISFVIFDATSLSSLFDNLKSMFFLNNNPIVDPESLYYLSHYKFIIIVAFIGATPIVKNTYYKLVNKLPSSGQDIIQFVLVVCGFILCVAILVDASFNPFLYFRF